MLFEYSGCAPLVQKLLSSCFISITCSGCFLLGARYLSSMRKVSFKTSNFWSFVLFVIDLCYLPAACNAYMMNYSIILNNSALLPCFSELLH